ncbi:unnamed protein product [Gongylonema pulchrum]|uniref:Fibronectin type-III domain-containing protein n=1 Tax=Gongylonema pulchrum TaxID=637853 RepID=A0A183E1U2_9BILA|nr:unnamed protein product [Gongylonema pulchrum]
MDLDIARQRIASEQLIKLEEARTINATAVKLTWKRRRNEPLVEGYYIKWRALSSAASSSSSGKGPAGSSGGDSHWLNVSKPNIDSYIVNNLRPFTSYEFFVIPYHKTVQGMPSNSLDGATSEAPPTSAPTDIIILGNGAKYNRNITTNERASSVTLFHLIPEMTYGVKVAARSNAGVGVYHGLEAVTMNEATLREHIQLMSGVSSSDRLLHVIKRPWFIATAGVLVWITFIALITFIWWRWRKSKGKAAARDALWMDHPDFSSAQRSLLLNSSVNGLAHGCSNGPPIYTQTPHQTDFYMDGQMLHRDTSAHMLGTMDRAQSPHHYHYAALTAGAAPSSMSTFYGGHQIMDDPSPYATTTLVMNNRQRWLKDHMLRAPMPPSNPVPSGPPPRFQDNLKHHNTLGERRSPSVRSPPFVDSSKIHSVVNNHHSGSPPHTDVSYVQSSDGTGAKSHLLDVNEHYDAVSDALLFDAGTTGHAEHEKQHNVVNNRPNSRTRINYRNGAMGSCGRGQEDDDSQRSSLMNDNNRSAFCSSSEADEENSDEDSSRPRRSCKRVERSQSPDYAAHRPSQPCMGISASALTQSSYDGTSAAALRSSSRLKSMPRSCKKDLV